MPAQRPKTMIDFALIEARLIGAPNSMVITGVKPAESECEVGETVLTCSVAAGRSNGSATRKMMQHTAVLEGMMISKN
jgi:hypothetical protein